MHLCILKYLRTRSTHIQTRVVTCTSLYHMGDEKCVCITCYTVMLTFRKQPKLCLWRQYKEQQLTWEAISAVDSEGLARACLAISKDADIVAVYS